MHMSKIENAAAAEVLARSRQLLEAEMPVFTKYIETPAVSPHFRPEWESEGHIDAAAQMYFDFIEGQKEHIPGLTAELMRAPGKTPFIYIDVPATRQSDTSKWKDTPQVLLYGHLDKQPEMLPWRDGLEPFKAVREGDKLYGRGGADDGYAGFMALRALRLNQERGIANPHTAIIIEASEESGSPDLDHYMDILKPKIGKPETVMILDSGSGNYDQPWETRGLRGIVAGTLKVEVLKEGQHSGGAGGIVPSAFRIARHLLERVENSETGEILIPEFHTTITDQDRLDAEKTAQVLGDSVYSEYPYAGNTKPVTTDIPELLISKGLKPTMTVIGANGIPPIQGAGNVLLPKHELGLSLRTPPGVDAAAAGQALKRRLEENPPYDAIVEFELGSVADGWKAPQPPDWLQDAMERGSQKYFGKSVAQMWEGGTIPLANDVQRNVPEANFVVTGILGPHSNAHGPNEFAHLGMIERLTPWVSEILEAHAERDKIASVQF